MPTKVKEQRSQEGEADTGRLVDLCSDTSDLGWLAGTPGLKVVFDNSEPDTARVAGLRQTDEKKWILLPNGGPEWSSCKNSTLCL